jgi:hypothetical protein
MTSTQYKETYNKLLSELPKWKQIAVKEDSERNNWSGILTEFVQNVILTAEKEYDAKQFIFTHEPSSPYKSEEPVKPKKVKNKKT